MATASTIADECKIGSNAMEVIYMSPNPYHESFDELLDLRRFNLTHHSTAGLSFVECDGKVFLAHMVPGTPGAKIPCWRTRICGAWLIKLGTYLVQSINDVCTTLTSIQSTGGTHVPLLFSHPELCPDISHRCLPIVLSAPFFTQQVHNQLNDQWEFSTVHEHLRRNPSYQLVDNGGVLNVNTCVMKLTRGKLIKQPDWDEWLASEYLQLDQYDAQGMFGYPMEVDSDAAVFRTVLTYAIKAVDGWYKARCLCRSLEDEGQTLEFWRCRILVLEEILEVSARCADIFLPSQTEEQHP
jgi:hypothetical protein